MDRRLVLRGLAGASALGLAAPWVRRAHAADAIELKVTHCWPAHAKFHVPIADEFMAANPGIRIAFQNSPPNYDEGHQQILRQAITRQTPDIFYSGFHLLPPLARQLGARGQMTPLDGFMAAEGAGWAAANYEPRMIDLGTVDGKFAGMPFNTSTPIVYYNAELVARAGGDPDSFPQDWDGLIALAAKIDALGDDLEGVFMGVHTQSDDWLWQALVYQAGGSLMDPTDTKVAFGDAAGLHGLTVARRLVAEGGMELSENQTGTQQFYAGKVGIIFQSTASLKATTDSVGQTFTLRTARYPLSNREAGGLPTGGNAAVILTTDAERAAAAWQFLKWVSGPRAQAIAISGSGYMPVNKRTVEKEFLGDLYDSQPNWRTSLEQIPVARKWYGYPGANAAKIIKAQKELQGLAMRGEIPVAEALARMVEETQALLPST